MNYQEEGQRIADQLGQGIIYSGPQMYGETFMIHLFTDPVTGTTFSARTLEQARARLIVVRREYKQHPVRVPSYPGIPDPLGIIEGLKKDLAKIRERLIRRGK